MRKKIKNIPYYNKENFRMIYAWEMSTIRKINSDNEIFYFILHTSLKY